MTNSYMKQLLGEYEKIILDTRQHSFVLISSILLEIVLILVFSSILIVLLVVRNEPLIWAGFIILIIPIGGMIRDILVWSNRQYIVTNRRVIQISGVINKNVIDSSLEKVNDVKMTQSFWGRLFNFGDVEILTASEMGVNVFKRIGDPVHFKTAMLNAKEELSRDDDGILPATRSGAQTAPKNDIPRLIADLDDLRQKGVLTEDEFVAKKTDLLKKI